MPGGSARSAATRALAIGSIVALCALVVFAELPAGGRLAHELHKAGHPIAFGLVTICLAVVLGNRADQRLPDDRRVVVRAALLAIALGVATEILQVFTNRGSSPVDVLRDAVGATVGGLAWTSLRSSGARRRTAAGAALVLGLIAVLPVLVAAAAWTVRARTFPLLFECGRPLGAYFAVLPPEAECRTIGAERFLLFAGMRAGVGLNEPREDWRGWHRLVVDVRNLGAEDTTIGIRVHDRVHDWSARDRFDGRWRIAAGETRVIAIPLDDVRTAPAGRELDLARVAGVAVFVVDERPVRIGLGAVRLE